MATVVTPRTTLQQAEAAIKGLSDQLGKAKGAKRQAILDKIAAAQKVINAYNTQKQSDETAAKNEQLRKDLATAQDEFDIAQARGADTTTIQGTINTLKDKLSNTQAAPTDAFKTEGQPGFQTGTGTVGPQAIKTGGTKGTGGTAGSGGTNGEQLWGAGANLNKPDPKQVWISYLDKVFKTIPDPVQKAQIDNLFNKAREGKWTEATFMEALKGTSWWQQTQPTMASFFIESHDPRNAAGFAQKMTNYTDYVTASMEKLGIRVRDIDPVTGKVVDNTKMIQGIAADAIANGWTDAQLSEHLATKSEIIFTGGGLVGSYINDLKSQALKYGINLDNNQLNIMQRDLLNPSDGKDSVYYMNSIKQQAIDANPWFAPQLKEGRTLYDVTSTYRNQMSSLLEVAPEDITWNDLMKKVVNKDQTGVNTFADFTKGVKNDPLWQYTRNAKETYSNTALDLLRQFGFTG
jgi:hypothetical protein